MAIDWMSVLAWLAIGSSFIRRKSPIGGYLLYFLWCAYVGFGASVYWSVRDWQIHAGAWGTFALSYAPRVLALLLVVVAASLLVRTRDWRWVPLLRWALVVTSVCSGVGAFVSWRYFSGRFPIDLVTIYAPLIVLFYTYSSERFRRVFQSHDWQYSA